MPLGCGLFISAVTVKKKQQHTANYFHIYTFNFHICLLHIQLHKVHTFIK